MLCCRVHLHFFFMVFWSLKKIPFVQIWNHHDFHQRCVACEFKKLACGRGGLVICDPAFSHLPTFNSYELFIISHTYPSFRHPDFGKNMVSSWGREDETTVTDLQAKTLSKFGGPILTFTVRVQKHGLNVLLCFQQPYWDFCYDWDSRCLSERDVSSSISLLSTPTRLPHFDDYPS